MNYNLALGSVGPSVPYNAKMNFVVHESPTRATGPCQGSGRVSFVLSVTISSRFGTQFSMLFLQIFSDGKMLRCS
jgi:hypothetical protein